MNILPSIFSAEEIKISRVLFKPAEEIKISRVLFKPAEGVSRRKSARAISAVGHPTRPAGYWLSNLLVSSKDRASPHVACRATPSVFWTALA